MKILKNKTYYALLNALTRSRERIELATYAAYFLLSQIEQLLQAVEQKTREEMLLNFREQR